MCAAQLLLVLGRLGRVYMCTLSKHYFKEIEMFSSWVLFKGYEQVSYLLMLLSLSKLLICSLKKSLKMSIVLLVAAFSCIVFHVSGKTGILFSKSQFGHKPCAVKHLPSWWCIKQCKLLMKWGVQPPGNSAKRLPVTFCNLMTIVLLRNQVGIKWRIEPKVSYVYYSSNIFF